MNENDRLSVKLVVRFGMAFLCSLILGFNPGCSKPEPTMKKEFKVFAEKEWQDTGIKLEVGDEVEITASGDIQYTPRQSAPGKGRSGPEGVPVKSEGNNFSSSCINPEWNHAALIAKIGIQMELIGESAAFKANEAGMLELRINDSDVDNNKGAHDVSISLYQTSPAK